MHLTAVEASYLASACLEASRKSETAAARVLVDVALKFDPEAAPVSVRTVRKALEEGVLHSRDTEQVLVDLSAVLYLASTKSLELAALSPQVKARIYEVIEKGAERVELAPLVILDLGALLRVSRGLLNSYTDAIARHIVTDPEVMGGLPVIRDTRVPVYTVLGRVEEGETLDDIASDFDHIPREALEAAIAYARTHPRRGRPRVFR